LEAELSIEALSERLPNDSSSLLKGLFERRLLEASGTK